MTVASPAVQTFDATPPRRSWFLVAAILIADGWLYATGLDGALSIADDLLKAYADSTALTGFRQTVAISVIYLLPLVLALMILVPPLPRRIFIPAFLCTIWANFILWPMTLTPGPLASLPVAAIQIIVFLLTIFWIYRRTGRLSLMASDLPVKTHLLRRVFLGLLTTMVSLVVAFTFLIGVGLRNKIETETGGYLTFSRAGVSVAEKTLTKGDKSVRLIGMVHIGDDAFYKKLFSSFPPDSLVLAEGVTDRTGRMTGSMTYEGVAKVLGLSSQVEVQSQWIEKSEKDIAATPSGSPRPAPLMNGDIDMSDFSAETVGFLRATADVYGAPSMSQAYERMVKMNELYTDEQMTAAFTEVIEKRNTHVLKTLDEQIKTRDSIVIPWGAQHMPGLEKGLLTRGYAVTAQQSRLVISFAGLFATFMSKD
ncbi:MAG: hypothetical protein Q7S99_13530 [Parvibaculum sp.]|nr:hypothetical protein [Parvibaculum sp.]